MLRLKSAEKRRREELTVFTMLRFDAFSVWFSAETSLYQKNNEKGNETNLRDEYNFLHVTVDLL